MTLEYVSSYRCMDVASHMLILRIKFNAYDEQHEARELQVLGKLPAWIAGSLYRVGPGGHRVKRANAEDGEFACSHWLVF